MPYVIAAFTQFSEIKNLKTQKNMAESILEIIAKRIFEFCISNDVLMTKKKKKSSRKNLEDFFK